MRQSNSGVDHIDVHAGARGRVRITIVERQRPLPDAIQAPRRVGLRCLRLHHRILFDECHAGILADGQRFGLGQFHSKAVERLAEETIRSTAKTLQDIFRQLRGDRRVPGWSGGVLIQHDDVAIGNGLGTFAVELHRVLKRGGPDKCALLRLTGCQRQRNRGGGKESDETKTTPHGTSSSNQGGGVTGVLRNMVGRQSQLFGAPWMVLAPFVPVKCVSSLECSSTNGRRRRDVERAEVYRNRRPYVARMGERLRRRSMTNPSVRTIGLSILAALLVVTPRTSVRGEAPPPALSGVYTIQQQNNGRFLDAYTVQERDFAVVTRLDQDNLTQRWILTSVAANTYTIQQQHTLRF